MGRERQCRLARRMFRRLAKANQDKSGLAEWLYRLWKKEPRK